MGPQLAASLGLVGSGLRAKSYDEDMRRSGRKGNSVVLLRYESRNTFVIEKSPYTEVSRHYHYRYGAIAVPQADSRREGRSSRTYSRIRRQAGICWTRLPPARNIRLRVPGGFAHAHSCGRRCVSFPGWFLAASARLDAGRRIG